VNKSTNDEATKFYYKQPFFIFKKSDFMKRFFFISVFSLATIMMISCNKDDDNIIDNNVPNATDNNFMTNAAYANRSEVDLAELALTKSSNDSVKMFAQMMITDHSAAIVSLDSLAGRYNFVLPTGPDSAHLVVKDSLTAYSGYTFDTAYINGQVRDHQQLVAIYQDEVSNGSADSAKAYASRLLPTLQSHLALADSISANLQ
jgi:putative membrane protein